MKRNLFLIFLSMVLIGMYGCSQDLEVPSEYPDGTVKITLNAEGVLNTRAFDPSLTNSANGGMENINWDNYDLRYQLAVYDETKENVIISPKKKIVANGYEPVSYEFRLIPGNVYHIVAWADFVAEGSTDDLHYNTEDFTKIVIKDEADKQLNDESRDAFFATKRVSVNGAFNENITLTRPFAKVRTVTTDWAYESLPMPDNFIVKYYGCKRFEGLNALTGRPVSAEGVEGGIDLPDLASSTVVYKTNITNSLGEKYYKKGYDEVENNRTLFVDYLFTDEIQRPLHFEIEMRKGDVKVGSKDISTNIPIQRNWLTTVVGNLFTINGRISLKITSHFINHHEQPWWDPNVITPTEPTFNTVTNTYHIKNRNEFAWLPDNVAKVVGKKVVLDSDIDMSGVDWKPIFIGDYNRYEFDGQNHTLRNFTVNGQYGGKTPTSFIQFNGYVGIWGHFAGTMKNVKIENLIINPLAHSVIDETGKDHSDETAYFAGVIGHAGQNFPSIENVHVNNIVIKAARSNQSGSVGGLLGFAGGSSSVKNCSVKNAILIGGETGGLIGKIHGGSTIENCTTEDVTIRSRKRLFKPLALSKFIGTIVSGDNFKILQCKAAERYTVLNDATGAVDTSFKAPHEMYGLCEANATNITITP